MKEDWQLDIFRSSFMLIGTSFSGHHVEYLAHVFSEVGYFCVWFLYTYSHSSINCSMTNSLPTSVGLAQARPNQSKASHVHIFIHTCIHVQALYLNNSLCRIHNSLLQSMSIRFLHSSRIAWNLFLFTLQQKTSSTTLAMKQQKGIGIQRLTYRLYTAKSVAKMHASTIRMTPLYL